jgi:Terpene cyclase DEP1
LLGLLATWYYNAQYLLQGRGLGAQDFVGAAFASALTTAITVDVYLAGITFSMWVFVDATRAKVS